jgi:hypothetical protein
VLLPARTSVFTTIPALRVFILLPPQEIHDYGQNCRKQNGRQAISGDAAGAHIGLDDNASFAGLHQ